MSHRPTSLTQVLLCLYCLFGVVVLSAQEGSAPAQSEVPPAQQTEQPKPPAPKPSSPFESVPQGEQAPAEAKPAPQGQTPFERPQAAEPVPPETAAQQNIVEAIEFRGARRVPQDTLRALIFTKKGDPYDPEQLRRDFMALWNTGRFDDIRMEEEPGKAGRIIRFVVVERRIVRSIKYEGIKSVTVSEILDRFKERRVGLAVESQYEPNRVQRAAIVLKEFLAERGRQYAEITPDVRQIPPSSLEVTFRVNEGPKVKVGEINIENNQVFSDRDVRRAMRNLRPIGIPRSILFENIFSKTFDPSKFDEDKERIRNFYQERGYFTARVVDSDVKMRDVGGTGFRIPVFKPNKPGKRADLDLTVEEGRLYRLNKISFAGVRLFRTPQTLMRPLFNMEQGDIFSTEKLRKGMENMRKLYGEFGYIDFVPDPIPEPLPNTDKLDLTISVDEGKQFFVRRIDFQGNFTTRDKVIRRELLVDEGDMFNTRMWDLSILRLNQLGYFERLKEDEAADIKRDTRTNSVDLLLKVKERGRNSVGLTGGVSGFAGSFVGFNYATNNFLGLGETLSVDSQFGDRMRALTFGFTEPYFLDRPIQLGFTVFMQRFNFDQGREVSLLTGRNMIPYFNAVGQGNLMNYVSNGAGFTTHMSYPLRRSFARVGVSYSYDRSNISTGNDTTRTYFEFINFQGLSGPNSLQGIKTSRITPSYTYNTVDHPITPTRGRSLYVSTSFAGLGGNVNMFQPAIDAKWFRSGFKRGHVIGMHASSSFVSGYGGKSVPPFNRSFIGGENDVRGFEIWGVSPVAYVPSIASVPVLNNDGSARTQRLIDSEGNVTYAAVLQQIPTYQLIFPGGDLQGIGNFEYRIPIFGPLTLAAFFDAGINKIVRTDQLRLNDGRLAELNAQFPQAGFTPRALIAPNTQRLRTSTGLEMQIMMPVVNAPFRVYWAYNPTIVREWLQGPVVADRSMFPNEATFLNSVAQFGSPVPFFERRRVFRFTISRTF